MKRFLSPVLLLFLLFSAGCSDRAHDLYETAQFEEQQFNQQHACELYRQIIDKYPSSAAAGKARERLKELEAIK